MTRAITVVGYGSLMSGYGLGRDGPLPCHGVQRIELRNARRGFGKPSIHANRLAMVLDPIDARQPISACPLAAGAAGTRPQALALCVDPAAIGDVCKREGYPRAAFARVTAQAESDGCGVATYLAKIAAETESVAAYRSALAGCAGTTSPHYIPTPIAIGEDWGIVFVAPGREGTGDPSVPSRRAAADYAVLSTANVWQRHPTEAQLDYIAQCILAGAHGVDVSDLTADLPDDVRRAMTDYSDHYDREVDAFCEATSLEPAAYRHFQGVPRAWPPG